jgi:hypothetical protein
MPDAAIASGGETMAPNTKASGQLNSGIRIWAVIATATVVNKTNDIASADIGLIDDLNSCQEVLEAASYKRGGRIITKTISGSKAIAGNPGKKPIINPAKTNNMGYGSLRLFAIAVKQMRIAIIIITNLNSCMLIYFQVAIIS